MTVRFRKKEKGRGAGTGYGSKKKHRGKGSQGGRGYAGLHKHRWSWVGTMDPEHYGYRGFISRARKKRAINVGDLAKLGNGPEMDLTKQGYDKLLSRGSAPAKLIVTVAQCSPRAKAKIEAAGGKVIGGGGE